MTEHSELSLPWCAINGEIFDAKSKAVFQVSFGTLGKLIKEIDPIKAAFIVKACNLHEELVGGLERLMPLWDTVPLSWLPAFDEAKAILARAKAKEV